jgi:predicted peptidase
MRGRVSKLFCGVFVGLCAQGALATDLSHSVTGSVSDGSASLPYRLFEPTGVAAGEKAPLVLFLHGMGERGTDNVAQTTWMNGLVNATQSGKYASYVLAPQIDTNSWFQSWSSKPTEAMSLTIKALKNVISSENVDPSRVYVTGLSMGGMGTWDILSREPEMFAAAVPMSGGGNTKTPAAIKDIPIWAFHGSEDTLVPVSATRDMIDALRDAGGSPKYTEVAGGGHVIWNPIYQDAGNTLYPWLFDQHRGELASSVPLPSDGGVAGGAVVAAVGAVPEPGSMGLVMLAGAGILGRRSRNTRATPTWG